MVKVEVYVFICSHQAYLWVLPQSLRVVSDETYFQSINSASWFRPNMQGPLIIMVAWVSLWHRSWMRGILPGKSSHWMDSVWFQICISSNIVLSSVADATVRAPRCGQCFGYINKYCNITNSRWVCSLCGFRNVFSRQQVTPKAVQID